MLRRQMAMMKHCWLIVKLLIFTLRVAACLDLIHFSIHHLQRLNSMKSRSIDERRPKKYSLYHT
jgi:hypothetical protein